MKIHLVDGTYELFRCYYGAPSSTAPDGREVGATRGFLRTLAALLRQDDVTHVGAAFDTRIESFRNQLFDGYKTGEGIEPELWAQFPLVERAALALGVVVWPMIDFEADDALATFAARATADPRVKQVVICSPDKDLAQCVDHQRVVCLDRRRDQVLDDAGVTDKFGVKPESIPDYLGLVGDTADGIPGVPRWGAKSTAAVLAHYQHIDRIPADAADWQISVRGAAGLARSLVENRDQALLYRQLATLRRDVPLAESVDDLAWAGPDQNALAALCSELGDDEFPASVDRLLTRR